jgi:MFS family permease
MTVLVLGVMIFGVYLLPMVEITGTDIPAVSLYMTVYGWTMGIFGIFWGWMLGKAKTAARWKTYVFIATILGIIGPLWNGIVAPSFGIMGYYIGAFFIGSSGGILVVMVPATMVSNWFGPKWRGKILGIVSASAVLGATVIPPLFTYIMQVSSLNMTFIAHGVLLGIATIIATIIFRKRDEDVLPWGVKSWEELRKQEGSGAAFKFGFPAKKILICVPFWILLICQVLNTPLGSVMQNGVGATGYFLGLVGDPNAANFAMIGALMMSVASVVEAVAKIIMGILIDRFGPGVAGSIFAIISGIGCLGFVVFPTSVVSLFIAASLFGTVNSVIVVALPLLIRQTFGEKTYPVAQGYIAAVNTFLAGTWSPIIGMMVVTYTYSSIYYFGAAFIVVMAVFLFIAQRFVGKLQFVDDDGNPMPKEGEESQPAAA